ncbi:DUF975 family protein [Weissella paramesenteroides]|uniref:DUF975 family protein n=1 Tax=Weissella paramesenteroides TaxID=1249 RepID=UPI001239CE48|nr:DUF975 family protein [Weissella paramesenteroides]KAA8457111.1 DUF975 family protein [Weissella paramesenteroides]KAA8458643.1 DUF975 family protein [Weissella paramesenteroides]KAA8460551.1 DUF975 family protein [Weissella paramesenteroides]KAA8462945.1 DUF975 family protein [Weissella paramesenteroides]KAA8464259.1 DUF975 family protein [Weissella paramesenteroides]
MFTNYDLKKQAKMHVLGSNFGTAIKLSAILIIYQIVTLVRENNQALSDATNQMTNNSDSATVQYSSDLARESMAAAMQIFTTSLLSEVILGVFTLGVVWTFVQWRRDGKAPEKPLQASFKFWSKRTIVDIVVLLGLRFIFTVLWTFLLIVPGIIKTYSYSQAPLLYADDVRAGREISSITAYLKKSEEMMRGYRMKLFWLQVSFILWWIFSALTYGVAAIFVVPYYQATMAEFYLAVRNGQTVHRETMRADENDEL